MADVVESYKDYAPPINAKAVVEGLIKRVPEKYIVGLKCVVLTNREHLSHDRRRGRTWFRGRKYRQADSLGLYHESWRGEPAWIEVFVDNLVDSWGADFLRIPFFRDLAFCDVVYHELGHHVHKAVRPEHREREDVAEDWRKRFTREYLRRKYWYLLPIMYPLGLAVRLGERAVKTLRGR